MFPYIGVLLFRQMWANMPGPWIVWLAKRPMIESHYWLPDPKSVGRVYGTYACLLVTGGFFRLLSFKTVSVASWPVAGQAAVFTDRLSGAGEAKLGPPRCGDRSGSNSDSED